MNTKNYLFIAFRVSLFVASFVIFWAFNPLVVTVVAWDWPTIFLIGEMEFVSIFLMIWASNPQYFAWALKMVAGLLILIAVSYAYFRFFG